MAEFRMPALGADMEQGTLVEWLVKPGDLVHRGQLVASVDTDKSVIDVETFEDGIVAELLAKEGDVLPVGAPLAVITATPASGGPHEHRTEPPPLAAATTSIAGPGPHPRAQVGPAVSPPVRQLARRAGVDVASVRGTGTGGAVTHADVEHAAARVPSPQTIPQPVPQPVPQNRVRSSPRARRRAAERGIDLGALSGTGPGGAVTEHDVDAATGAPAAAAPPAPAPTAPAPVASASAAEKAPGTAARTAGLRRTVANLMARSKKTIPHYYLSTTIDMSAAMRWMASANASRPLSSRLVPAVLLLRATSLAVQEAPELNGYFVDGGFQPSARVNLGVVIALRSGGILAPAILDSGSLALDDLRQRFGDLVSRTRAGRLQRTEMTEATITVTNLGDLGVDSVIGVIYPPQVAIVGFGRLTEQPWAHDGMLGVRPALIATLSADHRVSDGMRGARFLSRIDELLQHPEEL